MKNFKLYESLGLVFRAEAFNLFNHTNYNSIGTTMPFGFNPANPSTWGSFGQVTGYRDPRILQLSLKLQF